MDAEMVSVTLRAPPNVESAVAEGKYPYTVNRDGLVTCHPAHEAGLRALGFVTPEEASRNARSRVAELQAEIERLNALEGASAPVASAAPAKGKAK